ncbi:hypothetical protein HY990_03350 [Candidatus Micrarchaeota archaeon]|nr:hypothetical protein [Candidatus Micrarchaeota archaeon]
MSILLGSRSIQLNQSASGYVLGPSLLLDNLTHSRSDLSILIATGTNLGHLSASDGSGKICDAGYGPTAGVECDLDLDSCLEYETSSSVNYSLNLSLTFRNVSRIVPVNSPIVLVPPELLSEMETSSGLEPLIVNLSGNATIIYEVNDREFDGLGCNNNLELYSVSVPINSTRNFSVAGRQKLVFLLSPILPEQWYRNNRFDLVVLSQSPLYNIDNYVNGNLSQRRTLRSFDAVSQNQSDAGGPSNLDYQILWSHPTEATGVAEFENLTLPIPLERQNYSYSFIYHVNFSYGGPGYLGPNVLSVNLTDSFADNFSFSRLIYSRMLSYGNNSDDGRSILQKDQYLLRENSIDSYFGNTEFLASSFLYLLPLGFILVVFLLRAIRK